MRVCPSIKTLLTCLSTGPLTLSTGIINASYGEHGTEEEEHVQLDIILAYTVLLSNFLVHALYVRPPTERDLPAARGRQGTH